MAVTKDLTKAIPTENSSNQVTKWYLEYTYENDSEGDSTYYKKIFLTHVPQTDISPSGTSVTNFTLQAKGSFSKANLVALCPVSRWDSAFANMVDQAITNPAATTTVDESFSVPS